MLTAQEEESPYVLPQFYPSPRVHGVLISGKIIGQTETPQQLLDRVIQAVFSVEERLGIAPADTKQAAETFAQFMVDGYCTLGSPALTNAGRYPHTLASTVVIPIDLTAKTQAARDTIVAYYRQNMGSGFDFSSYRDPVDTLAWVNTIAREETVTGRYDRYIGNMGTLAVSHPQVRSFVHAKRNCHDISYFNISVNVTEQFMQAALANESFRLDDGTSIKAADLLNDIAHNAWYNGDPGILYMDRINHDNPVAIISPYITTPPCADMVTLLLERLT